MTKDALSNPASLSAELAALFPPGALVAEVTGPVSREQLSPAELQSIAHCAEKRIQDFTAGRACARRALQELGIAGFSLLSGPKREPLWPRSIVGSITHTTGYAAAVVARQTDLQSVGIDCEIIRSVDKELWSQICTPGELERLARLPADQGGLQAALIFAAKEAFYKCQFPLTGAWVGFEDVEIEPVPSLDSAQSFRLIPRNTLPLDRSAMARLICRFRLLETRVVATVALQPPPV